jgi:signal peptidase I
VRDPVSAEDIWGEQDAAQASMRSRASVVHADPFTTTVAPRTDASGPEATGVPSDGVSVPGPAKASEETPAKATSGGDSPEDRSERKGGVGFLRELPVLLLVAFLLALLIKTFLVQAFFIPSESMVPTLEIGDRVLVNKVVYHLHPPRRGDVIVFSDPHPEPQPHRNPASAFVHWLSEGFGVSTTPDKDFIKRVIGLPGETVEIHRGIVYIDGKALDEPYLTQSARQINDFGPVKVPPASLFVMGDNRQNSNDSRFPTLGYIPESKVIGRAFVIIWPPSRARLLHGL